ncbi:hypothetical protein HPB48_015994 [Haemaphysalis longicornis]|uniref:Uncharacterized protein n=1 Tax=Haemaphysalis longicornis TaxID=44386 RepID=A0A9J6FRX6_HAELO|nr:hypothetical protein HPB48_015994 [Haemaphysalis longicornis]
MVIPTMYTSLWGAFNVVCFNILVFLTLVAHTRAVFSDPGTVPLPETNLDFSDALRANKPSDDKSNWKMITSCGFIAARIHSVCLLVESILFGVFVIAIMCDQAILSDETAIEQMQKKGPFRARKPKMALLSEVCGRGPQRGTGRHSTSLLPVLLKVLGRMHPRSLQGVNLLQGTT